MRIVKRAQRRCGACASTASLVLLLTLPPLCLGAPAADLGPGDTISVTVFRNPDLSTETRISPEGTIVFPLIGRVELAGLTVSDAGQLIADALREGNFVRDPQVGVSLVEVRSRRVAVLGHVARPGQYPLDGVPLSLTDALALAGGVTDSGDSKVVVLTDRNGETERIEVDVPAIYRDGDVSRDIELASGDTVFVPTAPVFYVYGAVQRAGAYRVERDTLVQNALSLGGGLTPRGSERRITIRRQMPDGSIRVLDAELTDPVLPDDVVHIKESLF
jgi:polysaccharide export outer membrane protein